MIRGDELTQLRQPPRRPEKDFWSSTLGAVVFGALVSSVLTASCAVSQIARDLHRIADRTEPPATATTEQKATLEEETPK